MSPFMKFGKICTWGNILLYGTTMIRVQRKHLVTKVNYISSLIINKLIIYDAIFTWLNVMAFSDITLV